MVSYTSLQKVMKQEDYRSNQYEHLHSVHQSSKIMKKPPAVAPPSAPQPKVYKVKPIHFRELVQQLTGAQQQQQRQQQQQQQQQQPIKSQPKPQRRSNLQAVAPAPLQLQPHQLQLQLQTQTCDHSQVQCRVEEQEQKPFAEKLQNGVGTTELILSPNFQAWFSFAMLSPGVGPPNMSHMEQASLR